MSIQNCSFCLAKPQRGLVHSPASETAICLDCVVRILTLWQSNELSSSKALELPSTQAPQLAIQHCEIVRQSNGGYKVRLNENEQDAFLLTDLDIPLGTSVSAYFVCYHNGQPLLSLPLSENRKLSGTSFPDRSD